MNILNFIKNIFQNLNPRSELIESEFAGPGVIGVIHPADEMYLFMTQHPDLRRAPEKAYFESGGGMMQKLSDLFFDMDLDISNVSRFLEFACGYGRFTRFLITKLDSDKITVSDIYKDAVDFQKKTFNVDGFYSDHNPDALQIEGKFDVIFVASLFSHLPQKTWKKWLKKLFESLSDGGHLIFSTHGIKCLRDPKKMPKDGFFYRKISESKTLPLHEYGTSYVTQEYVNEISMEISGRKPARYYEQYLWNYQDVYVMRK